MLTWLKDEVFSIRKASTENLKIIVSLFGVDWCKEKLLKKIEDMHSSTIFSQRMTALYAYQVLIEIITPKLIEQNILPILFKLVDDIVPNIRFTSVKTIQLSYPFLKNEACKTRAVEVLTSLKNDEDRDVRITVEKVFIIIL
jgi:serine/threonine-protein phosphatase 2A regulatory subunit A